MSQSVIATQTLPQVSIVMPVYNCGPEILGAVQSALGQNGVDTELVIVDDGSTQETRYLLKSIAEQFGDRVTLVHQSNGGPAAARNRGLREARHDWIAFLDHDDEWSPNKLSLQLKAARETDSDLVYTAAKNVGETSRVDAVRAAPILNNELELYPELLNDNFITLSSVLVRREKLQESSGFDERWRGVEDWALWLKLARNGCRFAAVNRALVSYRWSGSSLSHAHDRMQNQRRALLSEELSSESGRQLSFIRRRQIQANERLCSAWFSAESSAAKAFRIYLQALCLWPFSAAAWKGLIKSTLRNAH